MRFMALSDLHGSLPAFERAVNAFERDGFDGLILAGDYLNHGPRNGIPQGHDPIGLATALNAYADRIIAVRGNCDGEVDQMLLEFPCLADYASLFVDGRKILVTHGHLWGGVEGMTGGREGAPNAAKPPVKPGDVLITGHTHVAGIFESGGVICVNPGSPTFPKGGTGAGYAVIREDGMDLVDFDRGVIESLEFPCKA